MSPKLKHKKGRQVAPLAGAWIEIYYIMIIDNLRCVAPLAGAWIEIRKDILRMEHFVVVAPLAGAWIEIFRLTFGYLD